MTDQPQPSIGTVAEEAARLISAVASMARMSTDTTHGPSPYAGGPAQDPTSPETEHASPETEHASPETEHASRSEDTAGPEAAPPRHPSSAGTPERGPGPSAAHSCSVCGCENGGTPVACQLCPLCQGIALLRSVRPETVDRLADLASAVATTLRDMATQSRASGPGSGSGPGPGRASDGPTVQDIRVDDEDEG